MPENTLDIEVEIDMGKTGGTGGFVIRLVDGAFDKTWQEVYNALSSGIPCFIFDILADGGQVSVSYITKIFFITGTGAGDGYYITANTDEYGSPKTMEYKATTANGYPS